MIRGNATPDPRRLERANEKRARRRARNLAQAARSNTKVVPRRRS